MLGALSVAVCEMERGQPVTEANQLADSTPGWPGRGDIHGAGRSLPRSGEKEMGRSPHSGPAPAF